MNVALVVRFPDKYRHFAPSVPAHVLIGWLASTILVQPY